MRDDIKKEIKTIETEAFKLGYSADYSQQVGWRFAKGNTFVWFCRKGYAVAELINNRYCNHRYYPSIKLALEDGKGTNT